MSDNVTGIHTSVEIARLLALYQQIAPHRVPLLQACYWRIINLMELTRDSTAPLRRMDRIGLPSIVLVGDDDGFDSGPEEWVSAKRLTRWARLAFIHATGGTVESYHWAVAEAVRRRKIVLVETGTTHVHAWHRLFAQAGVASINLIPSNGGAHPISPSREELN